MAQIAKNAENAENAKDADLICPVSRRIIHRRGQVLVMTLLAIALLVGLVFYVYNLGGNVNRRVAMQNAADAVAVSGAGWIARSMNVVAMNNVAQSRMIAMTVVLDSMPLATQMAHYEADQWERCLAGQLQRGVPRTKNDYLRDGIESLRYRLAVQRDILQPVAEALNSDAFDMDEITNWSVRDADGPPPHGKLWRAAAALEDFSRAVVESSGILAQADAVRFGQANNAGVAFLSPVMPQMPASMGEFDDFKPILRGKLRVDNQTAYHQPTGGAGGLTPDVAYPHRLGPWATLFKHRDWTYKGSGRWVSTGGGQVRGSAGNVSVSGRSRGSSARTSGGYWLPRKKTITGYVAHGPFNWALRRISWYADDHWPHDWQTRTYHPGELDDTFFSEYLNQLSSDKLDYMFGATGTKKVHYPDYIIPYNQSRNRAETDEKSVKRTMFYLVEIASKVPDGQPGFMNPGTYRTNGDRPMTIWADGWVDPADWSVPKLANHIWRDSYTYETTADPDIGINLVLDEQGNPIWQKVYAVAWYIFGGIDVGDDVDVSNPCNWAEDDVKPAPVLLDGGGRQLEQVAADTGWAVRVYPYEYLGVVRKTAKPLVWPQKFSSANPLGAMVTLAQAKVFNNTSWDLWTQDWHVQLAPVGKWGGWVDQLDRDVANATLTEGLVSEDELRLIHEYLSRLDEDLADLYMNH